MIMWTDFCVCQSELPESQDFGEKSNNNFIKHTEDFLYMDLGFMENGPASLPDVLC